MNANLYRSKFGAWNDYNHAIFGYANHQYNNVQNRKFTNKFPACVCVRVQDFSLIKLNESFVCRD